MTAMQKSLLEEDASGLYLSYFYIWNTDIQIEIMIASFCFVCGCLCWFVWNCRYLIWELHRTVTGQDSSVFCRAEQQGKWKLKPGVSFHFFTSHTPCESSFCTFPFWLWHKLREIRHVAVLGVLNLPVYSSYVFPVLLKAGSNFIHSSLITAVIQKNPILCICKAVMLPSSPCLRASVCLVLPSH